MLAILEETVSGGEGIARLIVASRAASTPILEAIRIFLLTEINPDLAMTDPALYRKLCRLRMEMTLRGWHHWFAAPAEISQPCSA